MDIKAQVKVLEQDVSHTPGLSPISPNSATVSDRSPGTQVWFSSDQPGTRWFSFQHTSDAEAIPVPVLAPTSSSSSPNDPLNWPSRQRGALLFAVGINSFLAAALAPILATGFPSISSSFGVDLQKVSFTIGIYMLGLGFGALIGSPTATLFGRRPVYVSGSALLVASSAWAAASRSYASLILARFVQGLAAAPGEFLVSVSISEIYTPQERGFRLGIYMLLLAGGKSLSPLIGAGVIQRLGWRWVLWILTFASGACFSCLFIFARETYWARDYKEDAITPQTPGEIYTENLRISPPLRLSHTLGIWNGRLSSVDWFSLALRPLALVKSPPLLWSTMVYALSLGWLAVLAETIAHLFQSVDGYGFTPVQTGLLYLSPLIGTILGSVVGGKVSDILARVKAYGNSGVYEPESRLLMMIPAALASTLGLAGYGWSIELRTHWVVPTLCFGAIYFGCILGSTIAVTYCLDCHKEDAIGTQVVLSLVKNTHGLAFSLFVVDWVRACGPRNTFLIIAGIHLAFLSATILMYVLGKRLRMKTGNRLS
ncbi:major facilitator superfamily domain-containing protein [Aspergillus similis]